LIDDTALLQILWFGGKPLKTFSALVLAETVWFVAPSDIVVLAQAMFIRDRLGSCYCCQSWFWPCKPCQGSGPHVYTWCLAGVCGTLVLVHGC